jgi:catechol 2,3-dioxygenase-like lactoylglutathione lyase family enzyme
MLLNLSQIGQIALAVADVDRAEAFYGGLLGFRKLFRFGDLTFFDCAGRHSGTDTDRASRKIGRQPLIRPPITARFRTDIRLTNR